MPGASPRWPPSWCRRTCRPRLARDHATGVDEVEAALGAIDIDAYAAICGLDPELVRAAARRIAAAASVAVFEDLGVQMNRTPRSSATSRSWCGCSPATSPSPARSTCPPRWSTSPAASGGPRRRRLAAVARGRAPIIAGLVPCNVITEEILTDHPDRYRALIVESGNPVHSLADTTRMREALDALEFVVVVDVAMTETARRPLRAAGRHAVREVGVHVLQLRVPAQRLPPAPPLLAPLDGTLPEPEIHARIVEAAGFLNPDDMAMLRAAAEDSRLAFGAAFLEYMGAHPDSARWRPIVLYRTLGPTLPDGAAAASVLWNAAHRCAMTYPDSVRAAGFQGEGLELGEALFDAIISSPHGLTFIVDEPDVSWSRIGTDDGRIHLAIPELLQWLAELDGTEPGASDEYPVVLSAGERRSFTANTIFRDATLAQARRRRRAARVARRRRAVRPRRRRQGPHHHAAGSAEVTVEVSPTMRPGHVSLPNGYGIDGAGVAPNELTSREHRDPIAGTPFHKHVPARLEPVPT